MKKAAIIALINSENKILFQLRDNKPEIAYPNTWGLIGGGVEEWEDELEAVKREIKEEINLDIDPIEELGKIYHKELNAEVYIFLGKLEKDVKEINLNEGQEIKFFSWEEIYNLNVPKELKIFILENKHRIFR